MAEQEGPRPLTVQELERSKEKLWNTVEALKQKEEVLRQINPTDDEHKTISAEIGTLLNITGKLNQTYEKMLNSHIELKQIEQKKRKKQEEQRKAEEERKREEQHRAEEQRKKEEEKRREEERRKEEEQKRQLKIEDFRRQREAASLGLIAFEEEIKKSLELNSDSKDFKTMLEYLDGKRSRLQILQQRREAESQKLRQLKELGDELGESLPFDPDLRDLAKLLSDEIGITYSLEEKAYESARQNYESQIKEQRTSQPIPEDQRPYHITNFYQLQIANLHEQSLAKIGGLPQQEQEVEKTKIEIEFASLKRKQKLINEIKIFIELYQVEADVLRRNKFDFPKYRELLARKAELTRAGAETGDEYAKIDEELSSMTSKLNTDDFLVPFRYPLDLLIKGRDHLLTQYFEEESRKLEEKVKELQTINAKLHSDLAALNKTREAKEEELKQAKLKIKLLVESEKQAEPKAEMEAQGMVEPSVVLSNQEEINLLYAQMRNHKETAEATHLLDLKRKERKSLEDQYNTLRDYLLKAPFDVGQYLSKTLVYQETQQLEEEEELAELLMQCEEVERKKQQIQPVESGIGRYSSIIL